MWFKKSRGSLRLGNTPSELRSVLCLLHACLSYDWLTSLRAFFISVDPYIHPSIDRCLSFICISTCVLIYAYVCPCMCAGCTRTTNTPDSVVLEVHRWMWLGPRPGDTARQGDADLRWGDLTFRDLYCIVLNFFAYSFIHTSLTSFLTYLHTYFFLPY